MFLHVSYGSQTRTRPSKTLSALAVTYLLRLEGARESAYLRQVNFCRCPIFEKF